MNSKSLRRLASDHSALHTSPLPPNYLFPPTTDLSSDLTTLDILLAGPTGTPYSAGVWRLHLDIPSTYPVAPPTAHFRTRLWHPNIDEATGAVCVETLKRDWSPSLKLRDVLVTISCLLIQPNPASALNEAAGKLASEDWNAFCRRARLMTDIHAGVPGELVESVREAQVRGEEKNTKKKKVEVEGVVVEKKGMEKGKERVAGVVNSKVQAGGGEDEENMRRPSETRRVGSDAEGDWILRPEGGSKVSALSRDNAFGIKGLDDDAMQIDTPKRVLSADSMSSRAHANETGGSTDPFTPLRSKRTTTTAAILSDVRLLSPATPSHTQLTLPNFSSRNTYDPIQITPHDSTVLPLALSLSWSDTALLYSLPFSPRDGTTKDDVRKCMMSEEWQERAGWEAKRWKGCGQTVGRWNKGAFGVRTGLGRL